MSLTGGRSPRDQGNRAERLIAKYLDGERIVGSGAYKFSNKNLVGDVDVWIGPRPYLKLEVKTTGKTGPNGPVYSLTSKVLEQMEREAEQYKELGCVWVHYKNNRTQADITVWPLKHFQQFVMDAGLIFTQYPLSLVVRGKKSVRLERDTLLRELPVSGQTTLGMLYCELEVDGVVRSYVIVAGSDVQYALSKIREKHS